MGKKEETYVEAAASFRAGVATKLFGVDLRVVLSTRTFIKARDEDTAETDAQTHVHKLLTEAQKDEGAKADSYIHVASMEATDTYEADEEEVFGPQPALKPTPTDQIRSIVARWEGGAGLDSFQAMSMIQNLLGPATPTQVETEFFVIVTDGEHACPEPVTTYPCPNCGAQMPRWSPRLQCSQCGTMMHFDDKNKRWEKAQ